MPDIILPIANGYYVSDSLPVSAQECTNWYPVIEDGPALSQETLRGTPGVVEVANTGNDPCRGREALSGVPYFVQGSTLYRLESNETTTDISGATLISGSGPVSMAENGAQLMIVVPGVTGYIWDGTTFQEITDPDFTASGNATAVVFIDGYFLCTTDQNRIIVSQLNDGLTWDALDFAPVESSPDAVVAPIVYKNQLFVGGDRTFEAFSNIGGTGFPFQRTNLFLDQGLSSRFAIQVTYNTFIWVGAGENETPAVWTIQGNQTVKVSNLAIDNLLEKLSESELRAITSWVYTELGHFFVGFNFPNETIVYDFSTGRWHIRQSRIEPFPFEPQDIPYRVNNIISAYGNLYCGDSQDGRIGKLSLEAYNEYGNTIRRPVAMQPFQNNMRPFSIPMLELTMESGVGSLTEDPQILMEWSRDGGKTWNGPRSRGFGKAGEFERRAIWRRMGRFDRFVMLRFTLTDQVKPVIIQATAQVAA